MSTKNTPTLNIKQAFYDIESLNNVFTLCNFKYNDDLIDVYLRIDDRLDTIGGADGNFVLTDDAKNIITSRIYEKNKNFNGSIVFHDLAFYHENLHLINEFGANDGLGSFEKLAAEEPGFSMFINDFDPCYADNKNYYLMGYNSFNYDTTMLALYINEAFWVANEQLRFNPPSAQTMREHNNNLFTPAYKERMPSYLQRNNKTGSGYSNRENVIRTNMIRSGRYIDVALLNEKMQKVGLKRVLGMLGYQILESDKLSNEPATLKTIDELADLIAYNVSDVVNLHELFMHDKYLSNFELKKELLKTYPELIYEKKPDSYAPDIDPTKVRKDRLYIDSSSAKLAARSLCPYGILNDIETVSFMYPHEQKAKEFGIPRVNVLDECRKFFYNLYPNRPDLQAEFDRIYFYYKNNIEGRNFNDSNEYAEYWREQRPDKMPLPAHSTSEIEKCNLTLPYYTADGKPSRCYVVFGTGGIHGAEYNRDLYETDMAAYQQIKQLHETVRNQYSDPRMLKQKQPGQKKSWNFEYNGTTYKASDFLKTGSTAEKAEWKNIEKKENKLFRPDTKGSFKLNKRYTYTSIADSNHEDFTSYYPMMLIMLMAFWNDGLGYDRYAEIFDNKQKYGKLMKADGISAEEKEHYDTLRNGTKLILNSASGGADTTFFTPIRMNNQILSMRIIGQLFTWRIGQAQTYAGADIISTNTDGLYSVFEAEENARILAREAADIHVGIEPEFCRLVSKDSNNRLEINEKGKIISASGGSLACYKGPNPTKSLAHAAIVDYALCEYLRNADHIHADDTFISQPFDYDKGRVILYNSQFSFPNKVDYLKMFQTIIASSTGSQTYIFGETDNLQGYKANICEIPFNTGLFNAACASLDINIMSHYNRIFFVKKEFRTVFGKPIYHLSNAAARVITAAQKLTRQKNNQIPVQHDPYALAILDKFGLHESDIPVGKEAKLTKVSGIGLDWNVYIENRSLFELSNEEIQLLINNLDMEKYLILIGESFNKNWSNALSSDSNESDDDDET